MLSFGLTLQCVSVDYRIVTIEGYSFMKIGCIGQICRKIDNDSKSYLQFNQEFRLRICQPGHKGGMLDEVGG